MDKKTSARVASIASALLRSPKSTPEVKSVAGSDLSQTETKKDK